MSEISSLALNAKAWPFEEARRLLARYATTPPAKGYVLFETGYGPSGLPHIGTFGEVSRTTMVRQAFTRLSDLPTRLFVFSDDMDGLRKVPSNIPQQEMMARYIDFPLTAIPDPFGEYESYGHHNNAMLRRFLDRFGFDYEFKSATEHYQSGAFDAALLDVLKHYDAIQAVMLPSLGEERQKTYSPFLPICPRTGRVLQVPAERIDLAAGTITYRDPETGKRVETPVTGGHCKLQWKPDWAMRWHAFGVDYEMSGKDHIPSVKLGGEICRILGSRPPESLTYELFLDENGEKISKSKGNGISFEEWLTYAPHESLALFMYQKPKTAKRLYFDVIPRAVDDYLTYLEKFPNEAPQAQLENPAWHIHNGKPPRYEAAMSFNILLNLASVCNSEDKTVLWGFISRYKPDATPARHLLLDRLAGYAIAYYRDFVKPKKQYRTANDKERAALEDLKRCLAELPEGADAGAIQTTVYEVGKAHDFTDLRSWFQALYQILLGQEEGPRMGSFIALYGIPETGNLIATALQRSGQ